MKRHKCRIGSYMSDPDLGAHYVSLTVDDIAMIPILLDKNKDRRGRVYMICPDCGKEINWKRLVYESFKYKVGII